MDCCFFFLCIRCFEILNRKKDSNVLFLIEGSEEINIMLYEYGDNNPVKALSSTSYSVKVQDSEMNQFTVRGKNTSDRISFAGENAEKIHNALMKGGTVSFILTETSYMTTEYKFSVNADYYDNAYRILTSLLN